MTMRESSSEVNGGVIGGRIHHTTSLDPSTAHDNSEKQRDTNLTGTLEDSHTARQGTKTVSPTQVDFTASDRSPPTPHTPHGVKQENIQQDDDGVQGDTEAVTQGSLVGDKEIRPKMERTVTSMSGKPYSSFSMSMKWLIVGLGGIAALFSPISVSFLYLSNS